MLQRDSASGVVSALVFVVCLVGTSLQASDEWVHRYELTPEHRVDLTIRLLEDAINDPNHVNYYLLSHVIEGQSADEMEGYRPCFGPGV